MEAMPEAVISLSAIVVPIVVLFLFLPWLIFHYMSKARQQRQLDEESQLLFESAVNRVEEMEERVHTLERILDSEVPGWRNQA